MKRITLFVFFISIFTYTMHAQDTKKAPCSTEEYKQFDFWVGIWDVYDTKDKLIGTNSVVQMPNACTIQENWESKVGPSKGTSYNYYDVKDNSWNQLWIDNVGGILKLKGKLVGKNMILKSEITKGKNGDIYNQITFFNNTDGTVTQLWEVLDKNHKVLQELFRGKYIKNTK